MSRNEKLNYHDREEKIIDFTMLSLVAKWNKKFS